jgi:hypothetical protein
MAIRELFAQRERERLGGTAPDVLKYDDLPDQLRHQIIYIWNEALGMYRGPTYAEVPSYSSQIWAGIEYTLRKELGVPSLVVKPVGNPQEHVHTRFLAAQPLDALSIVELVFQEIQTQGARGGDPTEFFSDLNARFRQHAVGYQFEAGQLMRMDTVYTHDKIVRPALVLLSDPAFKGANDEFLLAHEHYRNGRDKEAINEALKAFESTMKCICEIRKIPYDPKSQAKGLIKVMIDNGVLLPKLDCHFSGLRSTLESGLPMVRNTEGGHGQGQEVVEAPLHVVTHAVHLAAANIVFLVESHRASLKS